MVKLVRLRVIDEGHIVGLGADCEELRDAGTIRGQNLLGQIKPKHITEQLVGSEQVRAV